MGESISGLLRHLLAIEQPGGRHLARMGNVITTIPVVPPGTTLVWDVVPHQGVYAGIAFWNQLSPAILPGVFDYNASHAGIILQGGIAGDLVLGDGQDIWLVVTTSSPIHVVITNTSVLNQFFEANQYFLIVNTPDDLLALQAEIERFGGRGDLGQGQVLQAGIEQAIRQARGT